MLESYPAEQWVKMSLKRVEELRGTRTIEPEQENAASHEKAARNGDAMADKNLEVNRNWSKKQKDFS